MAYIGKLPTVGNFQVCDAITVVNGQAAYTMQVSSVNVIPESANHMLVSLNGILQKAGSSFTVSSSTITFASNLVTGDVIDFIQILGNVLDLGVPSDATVSTAKIVDANVTTAKIADANVTLAKLSATGTKDSTTFLRGDNTFNTELLTPLSSDTQSTPETVLTLSTKFSSTGSDGAAGSGSRLEFKIPDDETNPITGAAIAGLKENGDDSSAEAALAFYISQNDTTLDEAMRITSAGHVIAPSLNTTGSTGNRYPLYWAHTGTTGSIEPYTGSIRAMKTDINNMSSVNWIHSLTPRSFKFRDYETDEDGNRTYLETTNNLPNTEYGLIAEEVNQVNGSDYILDKQTDEDGNENVKGVLYHNLVPVLLKAVQEQKTKIEELEARITTLENA